MKIPDWRWIIRWRIAYPIRHGHSYTKYYEIAVRRTLIQLSGKSFWDVGANTGYYTLMLAKNFDRVTAFEPDPTSAVILERKIARHHLTNIRVVPVALADSRGTSRLYIHSRIRKGSIGSSNTLMATPPDARAGVAESNRPATTQSVEVETDTVDDRLGTETVDLMKIDVEGAEFLVLKGARSALREGRISSLLIELHDSKRKDELDALLAEYRYRTKWLDFAMESPTNHVLATRYKSLSRWNLV